MDDLPLILASKDLFLSLSSLKIKTLKQAQNYLQTNNNSKLLAVVEDYKNSKRKVLDELGRPQEKSKIYKQIYFDEKDPLGYYWSVPSIVQILGHKGSGKTALSLKLAEQFYGYQKEKSIKVLNCGGGITIDRLKKLSQIRKYQYVDVFSMEQLLEILKRLKNRKQEGLLVLDGVVGLILGATTQKNSLGEELTSLREQGWVILYTNLIQGKLEVEQRQVVNSMGYFPNLFGGLVDCRLRIDPHEQKLDYFVVRILKVLNNKSYQFQVKMSAEGLSELIMQKYL